MKRRLAPNIAGAIGYLIALLSWVWSAMLLFTGTVILDSLEHTQETDPTPVVKLPEFSLPEPISIAFAAILVVFMLGLTIYLIYKAPATAIKASSRNLHKSADKALTIVQQRHMNTPKKARLLTARFVFYGKLALAVVPFIIVAGLALLNSSDMEITPDLAILVSASLSLLAVTNFSIQYGLARLLNVPTKTLI